mmetsp:Transcript_20691/g.26852  ORF Transcript_20691/g.26852 Transcript_20691/m.26852 type:complete len:124 (+) Transcript_20691:110-481(+)
MFGIKIVSAICLLFCAVSCSAFVNSFTGSAVAAPKISGNSNLVMRARNCDLTGAKPNRKAMLISFSHRRTHTVQHLNLQKKKFYWEEGKKNVTLRVSTKGLRTIKKYGIDKAAKKYNVDLSKF